MISCNADAVIVTRKFDYHRVLYVTSCNADAVTVKRKFETCLSQTWKWTFVIMYRWCSYCNPETWNLSITDFKRVDVSDTAVTILLDIVWQHIRNHFSMYGQRWFVYQCVTYYWSLLCSAILSSWADSKRSYVILREWIVFIYFIFYSTFLLSTEMVCSQRWHVILNNWL